MPRCKKQRICSCTLRMLNGQVFKPIGIPAKDLPMIELYEDELEALRLCDLEDLTQDEAGSRMGISRGTVQRLLQSGRKKIVKAIVERCALVIKDLSI